MKGTAIVVVLGFSILLASTCLAERPLPEVRIEPLMAPEPVPELPPTGQQDIAPISPVVDPTSEVDGEQINVLLTDEECKSLLENYFEPSKQHADEESSSLQESYLDCLRRSVEKE